MIFYLANQIVQDMTTSVLRALKGRIERMLVIAPTNFAVDSIFNRCGHAYKAFQRIKEYCTSSVTNLSTFVISHHQPPCTLSSAFQRLLPHTHSSVGFI